MKKLLSVKYSTWSFNLSMLLIRISFGTMILMGHGLGKLQKFDVLQTQFYSFLGMGSRASLVLDIFAEVFCSLFVIIGLFTRFSVIPLIIAMMVAIFGHDAHKPLIESELSLLFLTAFITLLFCGPGKVSVDGMINK